jgi:hypothetical protein
LEKEGDLNMEFKREIKGKNYKINVGFELRNALAKRWVATCEQLGCLEEVGSNPMEAVRRLERKIIAFAS